jgi:hypothetical protein
MVAVEGGYGGGAQTVESKEILHEGKVISLIRVNKNNAWLLKACGGRSCHRGGLRRTRIIEELREKLESNAEAHAHATTAVRSAVADQEDPMLQLEELVVIEEHAAKRTKPEKRRCVDNLQSVEVNEKLGMPQLRTVRVMCSTRNTLWIHEVDVPWLVTYMAEELASGGVGPIDDAEGDMEEECQERNQELLVQGAAVAAPLLLDPVTPVKGKKALGKVRWDFNGAWEAVISRGP